MQIKIAEDLIHIKIQNNPNKNITIQEETSKDRTN